MISFDELWNLLYKELEIIEYDALETMRRKSVEKIYRTRYDSVIEKLKEFKEVEFVAEDYEFIWFKIIL